MSKIDITTTGLIWLGKYNEDSTPGEGPGLMAIVIDASMAMAWCLCDREDLTRPDQPLSSRKSSAAELMQ